MLLLRDIAHIDPTKRRTLIPLYYTLERIFYIYITSRDLKSIESTVISGHNYISEIYHVLSITHTNA